MGKTPPRKEIEYWSNGALPWVSIADLVADGTVTSTKECVNNYAAEHTFKGKISKAGTLLMSFKLTVEKVSILGIDAFHNEYQSLLKGVLPCCFLYSVENSLK